MDNAGHHTENQGSSRVVDHGCTAPHDDSSHHWTVDDIFQTHLPVEETADASTGNHRGSDAV
jgi:hypothetical protein